MLCHASRIMRQIGIDEHTGGVKPYGYPKFLQWLSVVRVTKRSNTHGDRAHTQEAGNKHTSTNNVKSTTCSLRKEKT